MQGVLKKIRLPYPPSVNKCWRHTVARGRVVVLLSSEGRKYRRAVQDIVFMTFGGRPPRLSGRLRVTIRAVLPDRRRRDLDNIIKAILDSLEKSGVFEDDCQVRDLRIYQKYGEIENPGYVEVEIEHCDDECAQGHLFAEGSIQE